MTHLVCPMCGLSVPLQKFNPEDVELDINVVSFRGLGRGKGFEKTNVESILGDDYYTPMIGARAKAICNLVNGTSLLNGIVFSDLKRIAQMNSPKEPKQNNSNNSVSYLRKIRELEKDKEDEMEIKKLLKKLHNVINCSFELNYKLEVMIRIEELNPDEIVYLFEYFKASSKEKRRILYDRIVTNNPDVKGLLIDLLFMRIPKTYAEKLMEISLDDIPDKGFRSKNPRFIPIDEFM